MMESVRGFFDLCVPKVIMNYEYDAVVQKLYSHGYRTIAIDHEIRESTVNNAAGNDREDVPQKSKKRKKSKDIDYFGQICEPKSVKGCEGMTILKRLTLCLQTKGFYSQIIKLPEFKKFDIFAVQISTENKELRCAIGELNFDILQLNCGPQEYYVIRKFYSQIIANNIYLELQYSHLSSDIKRSAFISCAHTFYTTGRSRNIIMTSGIQSIDEIKNPYDIINIGAILGLSQAQCKDAVLGNCLKVYQRSVGRRLGKVTMMTETVETRVVSAMDVDHNDDVVENLENSVIEISDCDIDEVRDVGHQLKKIKT